MCQCSITGGDVLRFMPQLNRVGSSGPVTGGSQEETQHNVDKLLHTVVAAQCRTQWSQHKVRHTCADIHVAGAAVGQLYQVAAIWASLLSSSMLLNRLVLQHV
jgi:hypothetical protein